MITAMGFIDKLKKIANNGEAKGDFSKLKSTEFKIDFIRSYGETVKGAVVRFDTREDYIYIDGDGNYFDCYYIKELGWSNDHKYRKVATPDLCFWVSPEDYRAFIACMRLANKEYLKRKKMREENRNKEKMRLAEPFTPDKVTQECIFCFFTSTKADIKYRVKKFEAIESAIYDICEKYGGRLYKTHAKGAKCAILLSPSSRNKTEYNKFRYAGYIVVTPEDFLMYFGRQNVYTASDAESDFNVYAKSL